MILNQFPDLQWLKNQAQAQFRDRKGANGVQLETPGWPTVILNTRTSHVVRDNIRGPLSIFTNLSGASNLTVDKRRVSINSDTFFISNSGQSYTLEIEGSRPVETFNIHIGEHFSRTALQSLFASPDQLLENHFSNDSEFGFHNRLIPTSDAFRSIIIDIHQDGKNKLVLNEKLFQMISHLVNEQQKLAGMSSNLKTIKKSTNEEIIKRLLMVTDYLYTHYTHNPDLDEMAQISCLSKFHFLRLFKLAYGQTPHQFIIGLKIQKAKQLLKVNREVGAIAHELGFETTSTFSRSFKNSVGVYPGEFRKSC